MTNIAKRVALGLTVAALSVGVSAGVYATSQDQNTNQPARPFMGGRGGPGGRGFGGPMGMLPMMGHALNLTDAQRDQIRTIAQSHRDEWKALADRGRTAGQALHAAIAADSINEALIREKSAEIAAVEADVNVARAHARAEMVQVLTADQKAKLKELESKQPPSGPRGRR